MLNGSTGEGTLLSIEERRNVAEAWANAVKKTNQHLMIQVGGTSLNCVKALAAHAESLGADSILCLPELYFKPSNADELIDYLKLVGEAAPKTPLLYYDFPRATGVNVDLRKMFNSIGDKVPTFVGVKTDIERGIQARQAKKDFRIFLAGDMMMIAGCVAAFDSFVMTCLNFIPEAASELLEFEKGRSNLTKARESQDFINTVVSNVTAYGAWIETMKIAMSLISGIVVGPPRHPLKLLSRKDIEAMTDGFHQIGLRINADFVNQLYKKS
ncbi:hypothetical protein QAD02_006247 [Eretmocerus hayati]|uniref:Uncharacterized protein n=1 Tax=Eretmocerus hayati TaxID=131215 RepID=A0ACC2N0F6_9HYME|nr:hypothetical protein QAD02_006247 [Eretmocerus hayati]